MKHFYSAHSTFQSIAGPPPTHARIWPYGQPRPELLGHFLPTLSPPGPGP